MFPPGLWNLIAHCWTLRVFLTGKEQNMLMLEATLKAHPCFPLPIPLSLAHPTTLAKP